MSNPPELPPILTLSRGITVRALQHRDAARNAALANNRKIWINMSETFPSPYTLDDAHSFIASTKDKSTWARPGPGPEPDSGTADRIPITYAVCIDDELVGGVGIRPGKNVERRIIEMGWWLGEEYWGRGIMSEVIVGLVEWCWRTFGWCLRLGMKAYDSNPASAAVARKAGFVLQGTMEACMWRDGKVLGEVVYGMSRPEGM